MSLPQHLESLNPDIYLSTNYVVLDFETDTSHGDYGNAVHADNGLVLGSYKLGAGHTNFIIPEAISSIFGSEFEMSELVAAIESADFLVAHNAKYELMWLKRCGLDVGETLVFDTQLAEYVLLGNTASGDDGTPPRSVSLDACCRRRGYSIKDPVVDIMMKQGINPIKMPRAWLQGRCEQDVITTEKLFQSQLQHLKNTERLPVLFTRSVFCSFLAVTEFEGMALDAKRVEVEFASYVKSFAQLSKEMDDLTGGINWNSPLQKGEFMYDTLGFSEIKDRKGAPIRTSAGKRMTDKQTLEKLKATTPEQREYVKLKVKLGSVASALSKNLEFFVGIVREHSGVFFAEFNQTRTATHRLSSSGIGTKFELFPKVKKVQFQNLPRVFKRLFRAKKEGWLLCETDGSQLEFRVAAHLGRDEQARNDILDPKFDAHLTSAAVMNDIPYDELAERYRNGDKQAKQWRTAAKVDTFKPLYGGKHGTKKQMRWYKEFAARYSGVAGAQKAWTQEVLRTKRLITEWGFRFYWKHARLEQSGNVNVQTAVCNYPVQSFATAEIIPIAVTFFWQRVREAGLEDKIVVVNTIHDSVICEVAPDALDAYREISIQSFTTDVYNYLKVVYNVAFDFVPLGVGVTVGEFWSEGEEDSYDVFYDGKMLKNGIEV